MGKQARIRAERRLTKPRTPFVIGGRLELVFGKEEWAALLEFQRHVNAGAKAGEQQFSLEHIASKAIYMTIERAYREAQAHGGPTGGDAPANLGQASDGKGTASNVLAEAEGTDVDSQGTATAVGE